MKTNYNSRLFHVVGEDLVKNEVSQQTLHPLGGPPLHHTRSSIITVPVLQLVLGLKISATNTNPELPGFILMDFSIAQLTVHMHNDQYVIHSENSGHFCSSCRTIEG